MPQTLFVIISFGIVLIVVEIYKLLKSGVKK